jgi:hypothetical protein
MPKYNKPVDKPSEPLVEQSSTVEVKSSADKLSAEEKVVNTTVKAEATNVRYREVVYLGVADEASRFGAVTNNSYEFRKDKYGNPQPTQVDERDYPALTLERGPSCCRRDYLARRFSCLSRGRLEGGCLSEFAHQSFIIRS